MKDIDSIRMSQYFPEPFERSGANVKVALDQSIGATKADLKGAASIDTSTLVSKQTWLCWRLK